MAAWRDGVSEDELILNASVIGEIPKDLELVRPREADQADIPEHWLREIAPGSSDRVLPVSRDVAEERGRMSAIRAVPEIDGLLAATAKTHELIPVTRKEPDVAGSAADVLDLFKCWTKQTSPFAGSFS